MDIRSREDLFVLLREFYAKATEDPEIGHHFEDLDLESHLPIIVSFWEKILFGKKVYFGDPASVHQKLDQVNRLERSHFERWVVLFCRTVEERFEGEKADQAKKNARLIGDSLFRSIQRGRDRG